ncbi:GNAT family N-acetyltransferase [candidate division KSB1 bacterium]
MNIEIDPLTFQDWEQVRVIFIEGIASGHATFETEAPDWEEWDRSHIKSCRFTAKEGNQILGWAALSPVSGRCIYSGVAEISVYVGKDHHGKGIGTKLLAKLIESSEKAGIWTLQAGIFPENTASIMIHKKLGFREVGCREKLGKMTYGEMKGKWRDVVILERRSNKTGID